MPPDFRLELFSKAVENSQDTLCCKCCIQVIGKYCDKAPPEGFVFQKLAQKKRRIRRIRPGGAVRLRGKVKRIIRIVVAIQAKAKIRVEYEPAPFPGRIR